MSAPRVVRVMGKRYRFLPITDPDVAVLRGGEYGCLGATEFHRGVVRYRAVGDESSPDDEADTVLHELLHVIWRAADIARVTKGGVQLEELVIDRMASILLDALRQNPALLSYLVKEVPLDGQKEKAPAKA